MELRAARAVSLVALMVEFHCGSSVEDYEPIYELAARLCLPATLLRSVTLAANRPPEELSLVQQTLRLLTAILAGHWRAVGLAPGCCNAPVASQDPSDETNLLT